MNFSRRKLTVPFPPRPASTRISASSTNFTAASGARPRGLSGSARRGARTRSPRRKKPRRAGLSTPRSPRGSVRQDADVHALLRTLRLERDPAVRQREQRVVAADPDVGAGVEARPTLPHEDIAREHLLAAEALHAEAFRFRVAPVLRAAAGLLVCHPKYS